MGVRTYEAHSTVTLLKVNSRESSRVVHIELVQDTATNLLLEELVPALDPR